MNRTWISTASQLGRQLLAWRPGTYLRDSAGLFGWLLLRALGQAVLVIALGRLLGATGYGHFVTVLAVATFFSPLAGLGLHGVLLRDGARTPEGIPKQLLAALSLWWKGTALFGALAVGAALFIAPPDTQPWAVAALVLAEVASSSLMELLARVQQARHLTQQFGAILAGQVLTRVAALLLYALLARPEVSGWMWTYAASSLAYVAWLVLHAQLEVRPGGAPAITGWPLAREGLPFAVGALSQRLQAEFNKPVLAHLGLAVVGNFTAAQRALDVASLPLLAMQEALWARLLASSHRRRHLPIIAALMALLALLGGVILWHLAPLLSLLLGPDFADSVIVLRGLAWVPAVQLLRSFLMFHAIATHQAPLLTTASSMTGVASIFLNLGCISLYGLAGAVTAIYLTEFSGILILGLLHYLAHRSSRP